MEAWSVVGSIVAAFVTAYVTTVYKLRREHVLDIDKDLRDSRVNEFKTPWKELKLLSQHADSPTYAQLDSALLRLTNWYYENGGIYLTKHSQPAFVKCTSGIRDVAAIGPSDDRSAPIDPEAHKLLFDLGSSFRTQMTLDLGSRFESEFQTKGHKKIRSAATKKANSTADALTTLLEGEQDSQPGKPGRAAARRDL